MLPRRQRYFAGLSSSTLLIALSSFFADISTEMLYPILPIFLTQMLRATGSDVGIIALATQNITQGLSGWLSDKLQRRKTIALGGYFLSAVAKPFMGLSSAWPGVLAARFMDRLGAGTRSAPRDALIASSVAPEYRGRAFGLEGFGDNLGAFLGPLLALAFLAIPHFEMRWLFYLAIIPGLIAFFMVLAVREPESHDSSNSRLEIHIGLYPRAYWKYLLAIALFSAGNSSNSFLILATRSLGASLTTTILIYAAFNLIAALISYPAGSLSDKLGRRNLLLLGFFIFLATYLGFAFLHSIRLIGTLFVLYGTFQGIFRAVGKGLATDLVPSHLRASGIGWYSATVGLMQLVASIIAGRLWDKAGHTAVFLYGVSFAVIGILALLLLVQNKPVTRLS